MSVGFYACDKDKLDPKFGCPARMEVDGWEWGLPNYNNGNAAACLRAMGVPEADQVGGELPLATARQRLMLALNRDLGAFERAEEVVYGKPREVEDGTVELRPLRAWSGGLDSEAILMRLRELSSFVEAAAKVGATHIYWG